MSLSEQTRKNYTELLFHELILSQGCTEPAAIAYAAALCRAQLGGEMLQVKVACSENLFKNAKSAVIPNTGALKGIVAAAICGTVCSADVELKLEILESMTPARLAEVHRLLDANVCEVALLESAEKLHIVVEIWTQTEQALVEISHEHTHVKRIEKNGVPLQENSSWRAEELNLEAIPLCPQIFIHIRKRQISMEHSENCCKCSWIGTLRSATRECGAVGGRILESC